MMARKKSNVRAVKFPKRTHYHEVVEWAGQSIDKNTHAVGFFILTKSGELACGLSHGNNFTVTQIKGACEHMKDVLTEDIFCDE